MEDRILTEHIKTHGEGKWRNLPKRAGESKTLNFLPSKFTCIIQTKINDRSS